MNLVVDLGQSGARVKIGDQVSQLQIAKRTTDSVIETLEKAFELIPRQQYTNVYLSLTGLLGDVGDVTPYGELSKKFFDSNHVYVMDDGLAAYLGAIGERDGVVLTLGGGVVAVASNKGRFGHADGKGQIFGDFGGGFWVGQQGLRRAISTLDQRDTAEDLVKLLSAELEAHKQLSNKTGVDAAALCISAAKTVIQGAEGGVVSAQEILKTAAIHLSATVIAAWSKVSKNIENKPTITFLGGLARSDFYTGLIQQEISKKLSCEFVSADGDHLKGAPLAAKLYPNGVEPLFKIWKR
ncbi:MAG: BadF/BadG/BcrA/BcrD ATPase family protein [Candidatus Nanopelagicaceae bacterium]